MIRTQISLTPSERKTLDAEAARTGKSMSALIREAIELVYEKPTDASKDLALMQASFGAWADREVSGTEWVESLRSGSRLS